MGRKITFDQMTLQKNLEHQIFGVIWKKKINPFQGLNRLHSLLGFFLIH